MTDQNNVPDTFGGGAHKRREERLPAHLLPKPVNVPTFSDGYGDPAVVADSERVVEHLTSTLGRHVAAANKPQPVQTQSGTQRTPLMEIAERIKKLIHDHGEQFGDELKAKIDSNADKMSVAKALQKWADDTLTTEKAKETESQRGT